MSQVFCTNCGSKHSIGVKFCSSCGNPMSSVVRQNIPSPPINPQANQEDVSEFRRPSRLAYEIQNNQTSIYKGEELFNSQPVEEADRLRRDVGQVKKVTREEYLKESLRECAPRGIQDIDET